jgi:flavin-dependent dehydrogenase
MSRIDKIIIVGGGSSGWMSASMLIKAFPNKEIIVIDSDKRAPIGVGESTYDGILHFCKYLEIDMKDFFKHTDASIKLAIQFSKFYNNKSDDRFIYPFGGSDISNTLWGLQDWFIKKNLDKNLPVSDFAESYFPSAHLVKHNRFSENLDGSLGNFDSQNFIALHFDALKFANWLKERYAIKRGVKVLTHDVDHIEKDKNGIKFLTLSNGDNISADLYIDCTGFSSLLIEKTLQEPFLDHTDVLPNNRAWATQIDYLDKETELTGVTDCTALKNGWVWNIPLWSRIGTGYVYSDKYTSPEDALKEFKEHLMSDNVLIKRNHDYLDSIEYKDIKIKSGIHERIWVDNVVAIGLSAGFIEPLESNGLFTVHEFLFELVRSMSRETTSQWEKDVFNVRTREIFNDFVEFIRMHYSLSIREDSDYWKDNYNRKYNLEKINTTSHIKNTLDAKTKTFIPPYRGGLSWIATGMNYLFLDDISIKMGEISNRMDYKNDLAEYLNNLEIKKGIWESAALNSPSMYQYLKEKYYE